MTKEQEEPGFTVTDKRKFREDGERRELSQEPPPPRKEEPKKTAAAATAAAPPKPEEAPRPDAHIDFPSYILSYYTQGLVLLGEVPNPYTNQKEEDVDGARHTIDILSMLQEKTKGNLGKEEHQLLDSILYELRMKYMAKTSKIKI
jgi:hypothetical protein